MSRVLFVVMPFCGVERPQIGVSTLKAQLRSQGIPCDIAYFNISFASALGYDQYSWITNSYDYTLFTGEWVFARHLFGRRIDQDRYVSEVLAEASLDAQSIERLRGIAALVEPFLDHCMAAIDWSRYSIVGFTSTFEQNLGSLALAERIKRRVPSMTIVMGGANCGGEMGVQLHRSFPFIDYVFTGEADFSFPELVRQIGLGNRSPAHVPGYVRRENGASIWTAQESLIHDLDALPYPDYDDFFDQFRGSALARQISPMLQIETARGCWWGAKQHCTFCGLNRDEMAFRAKSAERALDEIQHLVTRYDVRHISAVDNIISMQYFHTLLPELRRRRLGVTLFYETKANLKREQVELLRDAGVTMIQPGIESFSAHVLKLMRKGVSPLQNVQLLKWCAEIGIRPDWNLLCGFPGENASDYEDTLSFVRALTHLPPAQGWGCLRLDRFSPYFDYPEQFGVRILGALNPYRYIYPFEDSVLFNLAYFFEYDFEGKTIARTRFEPVRQELERWRDRASVERLEIVHRDREAVIVHDTRTHRRSPAYRFGQPEKSLIEFCDSPRSMDAIEDHLQGHRNGRRVDRAWIKGFVDYLVSHRLMVGEGDRYLSVILPQAKAARPTATSWPAA